MSTHDEVIQPLDWKKKQLEMEKLAGFILQSAKTKGASEVQLSLGNTQGVSVEVRNQQIETLEFNCDRGLSLTLYKGKRKGQASTTDLSKQGIEQTINAALSIASYTAEDPFAGLAEKQHLATEFPDLELYHPWQTSVGALIQLAKTSEKIALETDNRISNTEGGSASTYEGLSLLANSNGFCGFKKGTQHSLSCVVIAEDEKGMQRDYYYSSNRSAKKLLSAETIGKEAATRTLKRLNAKQAQQGRYPVLFSPEMARTVFSHLLSAISGGQIYRNTSFLVDALGQQLFPKWFNLKEIPLLKGGHASKSFDGEGVTTQEKYIVEEGRLNHFLLSSYSARKLAMQTSGNAGGTTNVSVSYDNDSNQADIISGIKQGLLVTELMGQGVNLVTGDYSRGAAGFWIENGEIIHPVSGITIAGNLLEMFSGIQTIGNDLDLRSALETGSMLINEMTIAI